MRVEVFLSNERQAAAWSRFMADYFADPELHDRNRDQVGGTPTTAVKEAGHVVRSEKTAKEKLFANRVPEPATSVVPPAARVEKPTPLEVAIDEAQKQAPTATPQTEEPEADPFKALLDGTPTAAELGNPIQKLETEKPKKERKTKKAEPAADVEPAKPEDKPLTLEDIRKTASIILAELGAGVIQEALAKFNAVDDRQTLRMNALREADFALFVQFLKKKLNDAAISWEDAVERNASKSWEQLKAEGQAKDAASS